MLEVGKKLVVGISLTVLNYEVGMFSKYPGGLGYHLPFDMPLACRWIRSAPDKVDELLRRNRP